MVLNEGEFEGRTILPRGTARLAVSNLMPAGVFFDSQHGFGAGGRVTKQDVDAYLASRGVAAPAAAGA